MEFRFVYVNCASPDEAKSIGHELVQRKMASSASIVNQTLSYYWWEGELKEDPQTTLLLMCRQEHLEAIYGTIKDMHSYSMPCIVAMPIEAGEPEFMDWMQRVLPAGMPQEASDGV